MAIGGNTNATVCLRIGTNTHRLVLVLIRYGNFNPAPLQNRLELLKRNACLSENALERLWQKRRMIWDCDS